MPTEDHLVQLLPEDHIHDVLDVRAAGNGEKTGEMGSLAHARQGRREHPMTPRSQQFRDAGVAPSAAPSTMHQDKGLNHGGGSRGSIPRSVCLDAPTRTES